MAVIQFYGFAGVLVTGTPPIDLSSALDSLVAFDTSPPNGVTDYAIDASTSKSSNLPISEVNENFTAWRARSFFDDYYNRIHLTPKNIDLGNLLAVQTRDIQVWNAYIEPQLLDSIDSSGTDGVELEEPMLTPTLFAALELRHYTLSVSTSGAPIIDASYIFDFPLEDVTLKVIGRRVVIWAFKPNYPIRESLEWRTDIIPSFNGEQRIRLRNAGRQSLTLESVISPTEFIKAKALAYQWAHRVFGVPVWMDMRYKGPLAAGSMSISIDTLYSDFRSSDIIIVWQSNDVFEAAEVDTVTSGLINLKLPLISSYTNAYVMPIRYASALNGLNFSRDGDAIVKSAVSFTIKNNIDKSDTSGFLMYKSKPVLVDALISSDSISDQYSRSIDVFDNGSGIITTDIKNNYVNIVSKIALKAFGAEAIWRYKRLLHSFYGRQKTFFIPSWSEDFKVLEDIGSASAAIKIQNIGYTLYYDNQFMILETVAGARYCNRILGSSIDVDGSEQIALENTFGVSILAANIKRAGILKHVRLDTDKIDFEHDVADHVSCSFPIREVPYVI